MLMFLVGQASAADVIVTPSTKTVIQGQTFNLSVSIDPKGTAIAGAQLNIAFNKSVINVNSLKEGNLFKQNGANTFFHNGTINNSLGTVTNIYNFIIGPFNVSTPGTFIIINATAIGSSGTSGINIYNIKISDPNGIEVAVNVTNESVTIISVDVTPPKVTGNTPASQATGVNVSAAVTATFSEALNATTINTSTFELHIGGANGTFVPARVSYNASTFVATLQPSSPLPNSTNITAIMKGGTTDPRVKDVAGNALAANYIWSFTTASEPVCPCSIWAASSTPGTITDNDPNAVELGMKFRSDLNGYVTGIRFYKGPSNKGTHVGSLWSRTGTLLGRVTFTGEGANGWQQATFATPVAVTAGTTYIASYHTNVGYYSGDTNYFASSGVDNAPLHALRNGVDGGNGVYVYSANPAFPINTYLSSNYWIDVVFTTILPQDTTPNNTMSFGIEALASQDWQTAIKQVKMVLARMKYAFGLSV